MHTASPFAALALAAKLPLFIIGAAAVFLLLRTKTTQWLKSRGWNEQSTGKWERKPRGKILRKNVLTQNEQPMFFQITEAFPEHIVLAQVSFNALIERESNHWSQRNDFNTRMADFVLCDRTFNVSAIIELDDASHIGKEKEDAARDQLLKEAGYRVLRYKSVPDVETLRSQIFSHNMEKISA